MFESRYVHKVPPTVNPRDMEELLFSNLRQIFEIEKLLGCRVVNDVVEYLILWKGYSIDESSWVKM